MLNHPDHKQFRLALVTGASSGIGAAFSELLASKGVNLILAGQDLKRLEALKSQISQKVQVECFQGDLAQPQVISQLIDLIQKRKPDLIVNNAGFGLYGPALTHPIRDFVKMLDLNGKALLEITLEGARLFLKEKMQGVVFNISSASDHLVFPNAAVYAATKAFVTQFSISLDFEMEVDGVRILTASPGLVATSFRKNAGGGDDSQEGGSMSAAEAAQALWWQLSHRKQYNVFDWKTKVAVFFARFLLPKRWVAKVISSRISSYIPPQPIILTRDDG